MEITKTYLDACEELIAQSKTADAIAQLMAVKEQTGYKAEIVSLSGSWKRLNRESMSGILSGEDLNLERSRVNRNLLTLIAAMSRELGGEKVTANLFKNAPQIVSHYRPIWQTYIPILITALAVAAISYFAFQPDPPKCNQPYSLDGRWQLYALDSTGTEIKVGEAHIVQDSCMVSFQLSGEVFSTRQNRAVDFSSRIAGTNDGEVIFVYENFDAEMGVCRGILPTHGHNKGFKVTCIDLIGRDRNDSAELDMWFRPDTHKQD